MKRLLAFLCLAILLAPPVLAELPDPVRFAVRMELGDVDAAREWLDEGLDPNFEGNVIGTGLMIGAWEGNIPLMELFLKRGADIHRSNRHGEQALMLAAFKNRSAAVQWLLDHGAKVNRGNPATERSWTALHYAAFAGNAPLVERLLAAGANVNARSTNGSTVVMMAAREGHAAVAQQLMAAGANPALKNDWNDDAVSWAMRQGNYDIAKTFTSAENFAELARLAAANPARPTRSVAAPSAVEEQLRMARMAEAKGNRREALEAYRKALAELKAQAPPQKGGAGRTAAPKTPKAMVIRAKRGKPDQQIMVLTYVSQDTLETRNVDQLLEQARAAEAAGRHSEAIRLFREASERIKAGQP
jgi:tetratricopeptide (TPR) repeat protein